MKKSCNHRLIPVESYKLSVKAANVQGIVDSGTTPVLGNYVDLDAGASRLEKVLEKRQASYGPPEQDMERTAKMWSGLGFRFLDPQTGLREIQAKDVPAAMVMVKLSREANSHNLDNLVDIQGWAKVAEIVQAKRKHEDL